MHRCFSSWAETVIWVLAGFLSASVILLKIVPVTVLCTITVHNHSSTALLRSTSQTETKRKTFVER